MSLLDPISHALAAVITTAHAGLTSFGVDPDAGLTWLLCIAAVVVIVRIALLPLVVHGVRMAHASARAKPHLKDLADRYRDRRDADGVREVMAERRAIASEHGVSRLGCLPMLVQLPIWLSLYHLLSDVAGGIAVGAMGPALVASLGAATLLGVPLAERGYLGAGPTHLAVVAGMALTAAALTYVTQKYFVAQNTAMDDLPEAIASTYRLLPAVSALGLLVTAGVVPVALLCYWVCNSLWTLGQTAVIWRWFPTPGSPAAARLSTSRGRT